MTFTVWLGLRRAGVNRRVTQNRRSAARSCHSPTSAARLRLTEGAGRRRRNQISKESISTRRARPATGAGDRMSRLGRAPGCPARTTAGTTRRKAKEETWEGRLSVEFTTAPWQAQARQLSWPLSLGEPRSLRGACPLAVDPRWHELLPQPQLWATDVPETAAAEPAMHR